MRQRTSAYVSIRQHSSAYVSLPAEIVLLDTPVHMATLHTLSVYVCVCACVYVYEFARVKELTNA